jgi:hypothetical protein
MTDFSAFIKAYGKAIDPEVADAKVIETYRGQVPDELIEFWERYGFGGFGKGLVWVVNPAAMEDVMSNWTTGKGSKRAIPVVRTAFGNIIYWQASEFQLLDVHYDRRIGAGPGVEVLFGYYLIEKKLRKSVLDEPLFKKALRALGELKRDEIYAFGLPLAMGGSEDLKNVVVAKLREHLSILSAAHRE